MPDPAGEGDRKTKTVKQVAPIKHIIAYNTKSPRKPGALCSLKQSCL